jgi:hypothetical protein
MISHPRWRQRTTRRSGTFDPNDAQRVKHSRIGVWDLYEELPTNLPPIPGSSRLETYAQIIQCMPYVVRMLKDILSIKRSWLLLCTFLVVEVFISLLPAVSLWYVIKLCPTLCTFNVFVQVFRTTPPPCNTLFCFHMHCTAYIFHLGRDRNRDAYCGHNSPRSCCSRTHCMLNRNAHPPIRETLHFLPFKHVH